MSGETDQITGIIAKQMILEAETFVLELKAYLNGLRETDILQIRNKFKEI